jgi:hypothetical protein
MEQERATNCTPLLAESLRTQFRILAEQEPWLRGVEIPMYYWLQTGIHVMAAVIAIWRRSAKV